MSSLGEVKFSTSATSIPLRVAVASYSPYGNLSLRFPPFAEMFWSRIMKSSRIVTVTPSTARASLSTTLTKTEATSATNVGMVIESDWNVTFVLFTSIPNQETKAV